MKKSSFAAMILGTISGTLFALGLCMALIPEWDVFVPGIVLGCAGLLLALVTLFIWRKLEHKSPVHISGKAILTGIAGIAGALAFGVGMCLSMVWNHLILGVAIGLAGIVLLLCLIPLAKGFKE